MLVFVFVYAHKRAIEAYIHVYICGLEGESFLRNARLGQYFTVSVCAQHTHTHILHNGILSMWKGVNGTADTNPFGSLSLPRLFHSSSVLQLPC